MMMKWRRWQPFGVSFWEWFIYLWGFGVGFVLGRLW